MNSESTETVLEHRIDQHLLDGGYLQHRVQWFQNLPYNKSIHNYCCFVIKNYGSAVVAFDVYKSEPSTKDSFQRRVKRSS